MDARCKIELLGGLRVLRGERVVTRFRTQKFGALLAYLAYHRHQQHPREVLIELLWPEVDPPVGRHRLSMALSSLRHQLEPPGVPAGSVLQSDRFTVRLNPDAITTDVEEFEAALQQNDVRRALALYRGPLLPGYYEEWIAPEMLRLEERYNQAREQWESQPEENIASRAASPRAETPPGHLHLPLQFTRFFGRQEEIAHLQRLLAPSSMPCLVSLSGPGGSGKTRLAIEAARQMAAAFPGGLWFVPLSDLSDPRLIPGAVLNALRLPHSPRQDPLDQVMDYLKELSAPVLLLLDNMEHLLLEERRKSEDGAAVVKALLERCPMLTCLVTSRQRLDLEGEQEFPVAPLPTPADRNREQNQPSSSRFSTPENLMDYASVQLFVDRVQAIRPDFQITQHNAAAVAELCDRLEGIPLAIELAAARSQVMTPAQMLTQLQERFDFLVSRKRDAMERHRTLWTAIEWSYRLLSPDLQRFFCRLSAFRGGWTEEAATAVCDEPQALDYLARLRECSLVLAEEQDAAMRFRMLETLREYAAEQLALEERAAIQRRHVDYFLSLAEAAEPKLQGPEQAAWLDRLETEHDNLRAALRWSVGGEAFSLEADVPNSTCNAPPEAALRLSGALLRFWEVRGHLQEGREWYRAALAQGKAVERTKARERALSGAGTLATMQGDYVVARAYHDESLSIARETGDKQKIASPLNNLGNVARRQGDYLAARAYHEESLAIRREIDDRLGIAASLNNLGNVASDQGDYSAACAFYEEALDINREVGNRAWEAINLGNLGDIAAKQGDYPAARLYNEQALVIHREIGSRIMEAHILSNLGGMAYLQYDYAAAQPFLEQALRINREFGDKLAEAGSLHNLGEMASDQGDYAAARSFLEQALSINRKIGNRAWEARNLGDLGNVASNQGDNASARAFYEESLAIEREIGNRQGIAVELNNLGTLARAQGDYSEAISLFEQALVIHREIGSRAPEADSLYNLGSVAYYQGNYAAARPLFEQALAIRHQLQRKREIAESLEGFASLSVMQEQLERAGRLWGAAETLRQSLDVTLPTESLDEYEREVAVVREALGEETFAVAWAEGRAMTLEQAIGYALEET